MRVRLLIMLILAAVLSACAGGAPTVVYIVVSPTPESADVALVPTPDMTPTPSPAPTTEPTESPLEAAPTARPANFPTPVVAQIQVAEQLFEGGRMFWLQPTQQVWVLIITDVGRGDWFIYEDTFGEGDPERDSSLIPPEGRYQPERGFGKLWRESGDLRDQLGWGVTPEFGYVSRYEYHAGGTVNVDGQYVPGPGYHVLYSLGGEQFRFNEIDGTWQLGGA